MNFWILIWLLVTSWLGFEYFALNSNFNLSTLLWLQSQGFINPDIEFNTIPGKFLSLYLGWIGFGLMVIMNVYSMRKRISFMQGWGRLSSWLNFHIFCGILGPTLIFYHCGLKVRGLVGISFWSMIISLSSGIIGRYFLFQLAQKQNDFQQRADGALKRMEYIFQKANLTVDPSVLQKVLNNGLRHVGSPLNAHNINPVSALFIAVIGDLRAYTQSIAIPQGWPKVTRSLILYYAINTRRSLLIEPFEILLGYWHTFHFPFAIFMYVAAVIHIISSLIFLI